MFSTDNSSEQDCANKDDSIEFSNSAVIMTKEGMVSDEVASAVAAVSEEISDILKDELGDSAKVEPIGIDLADLSAELGLLAGFADGAQRADFPSLLEIALGHRGSASGSASGSSSGSTWSGGHNKTQRQIRNRPRRRPIHKGKEMSYRRAGAVCRPVRKCESDPSDVGDTDDSDTDQWTELDDTCSSASSSKEENASANIDCNGYKVIQKPEVEMGQFLLPLLNVDEETPSSEHFLIRHEDILQLLASAEDNVRPELSENISEDASVDRSEQGSPNSIEDESALLNYMCSAVGELLSISGCGPCPLPSWLMGVYHCWCEVAALIRTMLTVTVPRGVCSSWDYRGQFGCHCVLCLSLAHCVADVHQLLHTTLVSLGEDEESQLSAAALVRCLKVCEVKGPLKPHLWDIRKAEDLQLSDKAITIIHEKLCAWCELNEFAHQLAENICLCVPYDKPMEKEYAVERFLKILDNFKTVSKTVFKIDMIFPEETQHQVIDRGSTADRLHDMRLRTSEAEANAWTDYVHNCECLNPKTLDAEERKKLVHMSMLGMMQEINNRNEQAAEIEYNAQTKAKSQESPQESASEARAIDPTPQEVHDDRSEYFTGDMDDESSSSSSISWSSCGSGGELARTVRSLMKNVGEIQRLMDQVMARWPDSDRKKVDVGLSEVDRKLMAMYKRLPDVHRKQLHVYKKQKKLSTVCGRVYGSPPSPPPPPPANHHTQHNFNEVRRKVLHMRDQQLYYHRLRIWLEDQLKHEGEKSVPDSNVTLVDDLPRRKRTDPQKSRPITGQKRKYRHLNPSPNTTHKILQLLKQKAPPQSLRLLTDGMDDEAKFVVEGPSGQEAEDINPPEAFVINKDSESDSDTVIADKDEMSNEIKECLAKFSNFHIESVESEELPEAASPPLEQTPVDNTDNPDSPVYCNVQRMITINKFLENVIPVSKNEEKNELCNVYLRYKYASFGMKIKKAMDECQNLINNYNPEDGTEKEGQMSLDQICEVMMNLDTNSVELLEKLSDSTEESEETKLADIVQNIPQILAIVPEISDKLSEFVNASFELPEFASIMSALPELNESQLTPETLKQIRDLKLNKNREAKVTKNTSKRKIVVKKSKIDLSEYVHERDGKNTALARDAEVTKITSYIFDHTIKYVESMKELREMIKLRVQNWKVYITSKFKSIPCEVFDEEISSMLEKFYADIHELALEDFEIEQNRLIMKVEQWAHPAYLKAMQNFPQFPKIETLMIFDFYIMVYLDINTEAKSKSSNITYTDIMKRCIEAPCLIRWMKEQTTMFVKTILDITGMELEDGLPKTKNKNEFLHECIKELNKVYINGLSKTNLTRDEWLITLYKLDYIEEEVKKIILNKKCDQNIREAELLAGKGLNILINSGTKKVETEAKEKDEKASTGAFLQKFKSMLKSYGECDKIKEQQDKPKKATEAKIDEKTEANVLQLLDKYTHNLENIAIQNAKQTLNSVGLKNLGFQSQSESDSQSEKKAEPKKSANVKESDTKSTTTAADSKSDTNAKELKNKSTSAKAKVQSKPCDPHICKVGHGGSTPTPTNCGADCDQPCSCCYCTVFGHAPPVTTPVPRNFNETRERLRSLLNKKKQKFKPGTVSDPQKEPSPQKTQPSASPSPVVNVQPHKPLSVTAALIVQPTCDGPLGNRIIDVTVTEVTDRANQRSAAVQTTGSLTVDQVKSDVLLKIHSSSSGRTVTAVQGAAAAPRQQQQERGRSVVPSVSSRDSSAFSTSSGCTGRSWIGGNDPRDLEALLQYIEGPAPTHSRAKKRAKKQRQKAQKLESRLLEDHAKLQAELKAAQAYSTEKAAKHNALKKKVEEARAIINANNNKQQQYKRGKKVKISAAQQAKTQQVAEQLGEYTLLANAAAKELRDSETALSELVTRFRRCWSELNRVRETLPRSEVTPAQQVLNPGVPINTQYTPPTQPKEQIQRDAVVMTGSTPGMVRVVRAAGPGLNPGEVTLHYINSSQQPTAVYQQQQQPQVTAEDNKKQTWEQALAHMNQLVNTQNKEKKKPKPESKPAAKPKPTKSVSPQRSQSLTDSQNMSKKQRKLLAKQLLEQEELKKKQEEALAEQELLKIQSKKGTKKNQEPKTDTKQESKKADDKRGKENKADKNSQQLNKQQQQANAKQQQQGQQQTTKSKKEKKREKQQQLLQNNGKSQIINITPDTTLEVVRQGACGGELDQSASCSIMEQLSCGVQVADLKLPPGITLTRVQPNEKKEPPAIKSVPIWKCSLLSAAPTPEARPQPVISADPTARHFAPAHPEPPSSIMIPETQPAHQPGKSKKAKKKAAKKAAEQQQQQQLQQQQQPVVQSEPTKMVTLRNPMFHPNLPPMQVNNANNTAPHPVANVTVKKTEVRPPEPIGMPPSACQATITPTSNGMFTIRNPLMSLMYQQQQHQAPPVNNYYNYPPNPPNPYEKEPPVNYPYEKEPPVNYPYEKEPPVNLTAFAQSKDEGYSLFNKSEESQPFLSPDFYHEPKKNVSPIGTRPSERYVDNSLFTNKVVTRPEHKREDYGLYTPFGVENNDVFRHALLDSRDEIVRDNVRDEMPYFQRLRVGTKLNQEVSVHSVSESRFFKPEPTNESFGAAWTPRYSPHYPPPVIESRDCYGPVAPPNRTHTDNQSMFAVNDLSSVEAMQRYEQLYMQRNKLSH